MGWTEQIATHYKNGKIDRKAECDAYFMEGLNEGYYRVEKSSMVGSTYYAAVTPLKRYRSDHAMEDIPELEQRTFAAIFLTHVRKWWFGYKPMSEDEHPYYHDCPISILNLLSETDNDWANEWRNTCRKRHEESLKLDRMPIGMKIRVSLDHDGKEVVFEKMKCGKSARFVNRDAGKYLPKSSILCHEFEEIN